MTWRPFEPSLDAVIDAEVHASLDGLPPVPHDDEVDNPPMFAPPARARDDRQAQIFAWTQAAFSIEQATSLPQRALRMLEEAIEAFQAACGDPAQAHKLVDFVFSRPVGELHQELGGVSVCLLALAAAAGLSADAEEQREVSRVLAKPIEESRGRNEAKNAAGFLAQNYDASSVTFREGDATWHDGPGWYYTLDEYLGEVACGAFASRTLAAQHARLSGHLVDEAQG